MRWIERMGESFPEGQRLRNAARVAVLSCGPIVTVQREAATEPVRQASKNRR